MTAVTRNVYRDGPPDGEPVVLSDKFVTPSDAIVWLDPSQFAAEELAEPGAEIVGDDEGYEGDEDHPTS